MLDFTPFHRKETSLQELCASLTRADLRQATNAMVDTYLEIIADCTDADVVFVPIDPKAKDSAAASKEEVGLAWTLGHVIVHTTASSEESAFLAAELARGVEFHGRSRYELPWETVTTIDQVRARLEESRRMRLATLDIWPDAPHFDNTNYFDFLDEHLNCRGQVALGLFHEDSHIAQTKEIVRQAKA